MAVDDFLQLPQQLAAPPHAVDQVRPIERADQHLGIMQPELADDVVADVRRGGRGVRVQRDVGEAVLQDTQAPVLRPEVMAPFADAVGLVDGDEGERHLRRKSSVRSVSSLSGDR